MTGEQVIILVVGIAVILVALAVLAKRWIKKAFYEYNEYTGQYEPKAKIRKDDEKLHKQYEKRKASQVKKPSQVKKAQNQAEAQPQNQPESVVKYDIQKKDPYKFRPNRSAGDVAISVQILRKGSLNGRYAVEFTDDYNEGTIQLFVDKESFDKMKVDDVGRLCYNKNSMTFYYYMSLFKDSADE